MTIITFTSPEATLQTAGGKGANLARLTRAGFRVPDGFIISTDAYYSFIDSNNLSEAITKSIAGIAADDAAQLENVSATIRAAFSAASMSAEMESAIRAAYSRFCEAPVAVRSSATLEDLPDLSFAGQQDTYLNVIGTDALLKAVVNCWSSLWTARAIGYRMRNGIDAREVGLAVIVQQMVQSDISGVLFTANPLTGLRSETVIDATFGLGEALVSGQVEPDHYVVESLSGAIQETAVGAKQVSTRSKTGGGVETYAEQAASQQTLTQDQVRQLVSLGQQVQKEYQAPQDIEWALAEGQLYLLQSRPITSLFPVPEISFDPLIVWFSFGAAQGILGPITPLGQDGILNVAGGAGILFIPGIKPEDVHVLSLAGERIWAKISDLIRNPLGLKIIGAVGFVEPSVGKIIQPFFTESRMQAGKGKIKLSTLAKVLRFLVPVMARFAGNMLRPERARAKFDADIQAYLAATKIAPGENRFERLAKVAAFMRDRIAGAFPFMMPRFIPVFGPSMAALNLLNKIAGEQRMLVLEACRGMAGNVTTEMDLSLWQTAMTMRSDARSVSIFQQLDAQSLAQDYLSGSLPAVSQAAVTSFMEQYGMRGIGEIDFGQPRWREDPTPVMHTLQSYLQIDPKDGPDATFSRGQDAAKAAIETLAALARRQPHGWLKEKLVRAMARRIRLLMGARESPKLFLIRTMGIGRRALLEVGEEFVQAGAIDRPDDLVFLKLAELERLSRDEPRDWKSLIHERRLIYERELRRKQVPRVLVSDGRVFYEGIGADSDTEDTLTGSPVSPGVVEGVVHVVIDPLSTQLSPGEILVCLGTDPAWTPLFMAAGGLITEVGGMMTHGSVVAREYGIPAIVGVHQATQRLKNGLRIRMDGTSGKIVIMTETAGGVQVP